MTTRRTFIRTASAIGALAALPAWALAAAMLDDRYGGYATDADDIAEVIWQDSFNDNPGYFDVVDDAGYDLVVTGGGLGGYMNALTPGRKLQEKVAAAMEKEGFEAIRATIGGSIAYRF